MKANVLDGRKVALQIKDETKKLVDIFVKQYGHRPHLSVVLVGDDPASKVYVKNKEIACREVGIETTTFVHNSDVSWNTLSEQIIGLNENDNTHGILVQLPLPKHINKFHVFNIIAPAKDVDVFTPINTGLLVQNRPYLMPCTPQAVREMLVRSGISIKGKKVAIVNRSLVVGQPLSSMLIQDDKFANATVTVCHEYTENIKEVLLSADIIVTAVGDRNSFCLTADMVRDGAVVIDVAIIRDGKRLIGDVHESVWQKASLVSPVPGGVGPVTIAMLVSNTVFAAQFQQGVLNQRKT